MSDVVTLHCDSNKSHRENGLYPRQSMNKFNSALAAWSVQFAQYSHRHPSPTKRWANIPNGDGATCGRERKLMVSTTEYIV